MIDYKVLGQRIKEVRKVREIKQYALAEKAGLNCKYISQVETGSKQVSLQALLKIAEALDVTADSLLTGNQKENFIDYGNDVTAIISGCNAYEKKIICGVAAETKRLLKESNSIK